MGGVFLHGVWLGFWGTYGTNANPLTHPGSVSPIPVRRRGVDRGLWCPYALPVANKKPRVLGGVGLVLVWLCGCRPSSDAVELAPLVKLAGDVVDVPAFGGCHLAQVFGTGLRVLVQVLPHGSA